MDLYRYTSETPYTESHNASVGEFLFFLDKKLNYTTERKNREYRYAFYNISRSSFIEFDMYQKSFEASFRVV